MCCVFTANFHSVKLRLKVIWSSRKGPLFEAEMTRRRAIMTWPLGIKSKEYVLRHHGGKNTYFNLMWALNDFMSYLKDIFLFSFRGGGGGCGREEVGCY